jgi:hypothetical protein
MKFMIEAEFGSTLAAEMSWCQKFAALNGTKPFKLAPCPVPIAEQAKGVPEPWPLPTCTFTAPEVLPPGAGLLMLTPKMPFVLTVPLAVRVVGDTNVVFIATPAKRIWAPVTNPVPVTVREIGPIEKMLGTTELITGAGFNNETVLVAVALASAELMALTVTVFGLGRVAGAVYVPAAETVPTEELPPLTPLTCHVTA